MEQPAPSISDVTAPAAAPVVRSFADAYAEVAPDGGLRPIDELVGQPLTFEKVYTLDNGLGAYVRVVVVDVAGRRWNFETASPPIMAKLTAVAKLLPLVGQVVWQLGADSRNYYDVV